MWNRKPFKKTLKLKIQMKKTGECFPGLFHEGFTILQFTRIFSLRMVFIFKVFIVAVFKVFQMLKVFQIFQVIMPGFFTLP